MLIRRQCEWCFLVKPRRNYKYSILASLIWHYLVRVHECFKCLSSGWNHLNLVDGCNCGRKDRKYTNINNLLALSLFQISFIQLGKITHNKIKWMKHEKTVHVFNFIYCSSDYAELIDIYMVTTCLNKWEPMLCVLQVEISNHFTACFWLLDFKTGHFSCDVISDAWTWTWKCTFDVFAYHWFLDYSVQLQSQLFRPQTSKYR